MTERYVAKYTVVRPVVEVAVAQGCEIAYYQWTGRYQRYYSKLLSRNSCPGIAPTDVTSFKGSVNGVFIVFDLASVDFLPILHISSVLVSSA